MRLVPLIVELTDMMSAEVAVGVLGELSKELVRSERLAIDTAESSSAGAGRKQAEIVIESVRLLITSVVLYIMRAKF